MSSRNIILKLICGGIFLASSLALAKGVPPQTALDKVLTEAEIIEGVPLPAGAHVVVIEYNHGRPSSYRTVTVTQPGSNLTLGPVVLSGDHEVLIRFGKPYITTSASNIGDSETHHNILHEKKNGYEITGVLAANTRMAGVLLAGKESKNPSTVRYYCTDEARTQFCFAQAELTDMHPTFGFAAEATVLDNVPVLKGDTLLFQADGHLASIIGISEYDPILKEFQYFGRLVPLTLMRNGQTVTEAVYAHEITFTRHHKPSVVGAMPYGQMFGIPLGEPGTVEHESIVIHPQGSYRLKMKAGSVFVFEGIPVGSSGFHTHDLKFDDQGFLTEASLGGAIVYGGVLLKPYVSLTIHRGLITVANVAGDYWRYAFDGRFQGRDRFVIGAKLHFNESRQLTEVEGQDSTETHLIKEYRDHDRIVRPVIDL